MSVPLIFDAKTPTDVLDRSIDFKRYLERRETIISADVLCTPAGLTLSAPQITGSVVTTWAGGGTVETSYYISYHIVTSGGRNQTRSAIQNVYYMVP